MAIQRGVLPAQLGQAQGILQENHLLRATGGAAEAPLATLGPGVQDGAGAKGLGQGGPQRLQAVVPMSWMDMGKQDMFFFPKMSPLS